MFTISEDVSIPDVKLICEEVLSVLFSAVRCWLTIECSKSTVTAIVFTSSMGEFYIFKEQNNRSTTFFTSAYTDLSLKL